MLVLWFSLLGLGISMSGTAIWLTRRDRRRALPTPEQDDWPGPAGRHREPPGP
ncbi:hypothetical protein GCM10010168_17050 [Actinoplanes ianthinogenes]|uniref:Uncharacterized protein n=1 Tax=Actinoplanes ianthinogenes TaxID=122358 RepID=A0ABN6CJJ9_9ACTN|nr:hypothetical protein [Actinoplanes ianthinogenes]BCJ44892.1 hypothetical protein Aiant_55490 [Actinoplanes ianthinogenes]GGR00630.1 hypothetical protein GCM10010168_17050 [Actinoplanes ianthinogenes]